MRTRTLLQMQMLALLLIHFQNRVRGAGAAPRKKQPAPHSLLVVADECVCHYVSVCV